MTGDRQAGVGTRMKSSPIQFHPSLPFEFWSHTSCVLEKNKQVKPLILKILPETYATLSKTSGMHIVQVI